MFSNTKRDRRQVRHASFVSRIEKARGGGDRPLKRRRPGKKLRTNLAALADALPDIGDVGGNDSGALRHRSGSSGSGSLRTRKGALKRKEKVVRGEVERFGVSLARLNAVGAAAVVYGGGGGGGQGARVSGGQQQGMQIGGGETVDEEDMGADGDVETQARTQTQTQTQTQQAPSSTANRWAALRGFISATMEQNPAFASKQDGK